MKSVVSLVLALLAVLGGPPHVRATVTYHVPALMYHRINCTPPGAPYPELWVCPQRFDDTLRLLKSNGWTTITANRLSYRMKRGLVVPHKTFVITIDDGDRDGYDNGYPILERHGFDAVYGVVVDRVRRGWGSQMTWTELNRLEAHGHEIADHSMTHDDLRNKPDSGLLWQIDFSAQVLEQNLGRRPRTFIYPFGFWNDRVVAQVSASGYRISFTTVYACGQSWSRRFTAPRIRVNGVDTPQQVLNKISPCA